MAALFPYHTTRHVVRAIAGFGCWAMLSLWLDGDQGLLRAQEAATPARAGVLIPVALPITSNVNRQVEKMIDQATENLTTDGQRGALVLEFRPAAGQVPEASELEASYALARHLIDAKLSKVRTIAYVPESIRGHAILPMLACEQIIMHPQATIGEIVDAKTMADRGMMNDYEFIVSQRRTLPWPLVKAMLDKDLAVYKVRKGNEVSYVTGSELEELKKSGGVDEATTVVDRDKSAIFSGERLRVELGFVSHLAKDRNELATALKIPAATLEDDPTLGGAWMPVLIRLDGPIRTDKINFITRSLEQRLATGDVNFICIEIDSAGGSLQDSVRLAQTLADLQLRNIRTVAYVPRQARGDAALVAMACDQLVVHPNAALGGAGESVLDPRDRESLAITVKALTEDRVRGWSLPLALVDRELAVFRYVRETDNATANFCDQELAEQPQPGDWKKGSQIPTHEGMDGRRAEELGLAKFLVEDFIELKAIYHLEIEPERLQANWAHMFIEQLARPEIAGFLLFIAFFTMIVEMMTPGTGVMGFVSAVCFLLFFWANVLHGTAGTLEILLFVAGVACLAIEMFALPGFGAFGIGGVLLIVSSVILASQTFVIPRNTYQFEQLPKGLLMVTAATAGVIASLVLFRKYMHKAPMLNRMLLRPPARDDIAELNRREALATFDHLLHKRGTTLTPLTPAGKAQFGDEMVDVVSDGEFISRDTAVYVLEVSGNRVVVKGLDG